MGEPAGEMACKVCGWWPPVTRAWCGRAGPASEAWRWWALREHIGENANAEIDDGRADGPHVILYEALVAQSLAWRRTR